MFEFVTARELYELVNVGSEIEKDQLEYVELDGWVRTNRNNSNNSLAVTNSNIIFFLLNKIKTFLKIILGTLISAVPS